MRSLKSFLAEKTGTVIYVLLFQAASLIFPLFVIATALYPDLLYMKGIPAFLFELGTCLLPRWEAMLLSLLYRATTSEIITAIVVPSAALAAGIIIRRLISEGGRTAFATRISAAALVACDLLFRLLPFHANRVYGLPAGICSWLFRALCVSLILYDIISDLKKKKRPE